MSGDESNSYVTARDIQRMEAAGPEAFQPFTPDGRAAVKRAETILDARIVWVSPPSDPPPIPSGGNPFYNPRYFRP